MATIRGGGNETPQLGGRAQQGEADAPEGGGGSRRSSPEPGEELVDDSQIAREELGLGFDREGRE
jgi:hypothetical protein